MRQFRPAWGLLPIMRAALGALLLLVVPAAGQQNVVFPYDQELLLEVAPMGSVKRVPILTVDPNGSAAIDLWCKTVAARVAISGTAIRIEAEPLPEGLPAMMSAGQCTPERMQADADLLAALTQVESWRLQDQMIVLNGPTPLKFRASSH